MKRIARGISAATPSQIRIPMTHGFGASSGIRASMRLMSSLIGESSNVHAHRRAPDGGWLSAALARASACGVLLGASSFVVGRNAFVAVLGVQTSPSGHVGLVWNLPRKAKCAKGFSYAHDINPVLDVIRVYA